MRFINQLLKKLINMPTDDIELYDLANDNDLSFNALRPQPLAMTGGQLKKRKKLTKKAIVQILEELK